MNSRGHWSFAPSPLRVAAWTPPASPLFFAGYGFVAFTIVIMVALAGALPPGTFLLGPLIEELVKAGTPRTARQGAATGLGFGLIETAAYAGANPAIWLMRLCTSVPLHVGCTAIAAHGLGRRHLLPLVVAVGIHVSYNASIALL